MSAPRSIADVIRGLAAEQLTELVRLRPDLALPRPADLDELIERATASASTQLALEGLDAWQRRVALALAASPDAISTRHLAALMGADRGWLIPRSEGWFELAGNAECLQTRFQGVFRCVFPRSLPRQ